MSEHEYYDVDVEKEENQARIGNSDVVEIVFNKNVEAFNIHKDDVIHLAKNFGLTVYENDSAL